MLSNFIKVVILLVILVVVGYVGLSVWSGCIRHGNSGQLDMPDEEEAAYSLYIKNSGGLIFTNDYEQHGQVVGARVFILHGFWELRGKDFKYIDGQIVLDENVFGEIVVKRRGK